jgi:hypothetical protein
MVSVITGIDRKILGGEDLRTASIAQRMCWASKRETTRVEDIAYCLMGTFGVNMPLLYGEGEKSFIRLQEEIMKESDDHSLFAWRDSMASDESVQGLLARSPARFARSGNMAPFRCWEASTPYSMTNKGLCIQLHLIPPNKEEDVYLAALDCEAIRPVNIQPGIWLKRVTSRGD